MSKVEIVEAYGMLVLSNQQYNGRGLGSYIHLSGSTFAVFVDGKMSEEKPMSSISDHIRQSGATSIIEQGESDLGEEEVDTLFFLSDGTSKTFPARSGKDIWKFLMAE